MQGDMKNKPIDVQPIRTVAQIENMKNALLKYCSFRDYILFTLGINIGLRVSDILKLQVKTVKDQSHILLKEKKTKKHSKFFIPDGLRVILNNYCQGKDMEDWLFPSRKGNGPITPTQAYRILQKAGEMAGIEHIGTHTMRKTFGYHFYKKTKDVATLMKIFSHSAPSITERYIGITQDEIDDSLKGFML